MVEDGVHIEEVENFAAFAGFDRKETNKRNEKGDHHLRWELPNRANIGLSQNQRPEKKKKEEKRSNKSNAFIQSEQKKRVMSNVLQRQTKATLTGENRGGESKKKVGETRPTKRRAHLWGGEFKKKKKQQVGGNKTPLATQKCWGEGNGVLQRNRGDSQQANWACTVHIFLGVEKT